MASTRAIERVFQKPDIIEAIVNQDWEEVYRLADDSIPPSDISKFTLLLYEAGLLENYMSIETLPEDMFYNIKYPFDKLPDKLKQISFGAFHRTIFDFSKLVLPSTLKVIQTEAFYNSKGITNLIVPESVQIIGDDAFAHMIDLESITFPVSADLGVSIVRSCPSLEEIHLTGLASSIEEDEIYDIPEDVVFYIDRKAKKLGQQLRSRGYEVIEE